MKYLICNNGCHDTTYTEIDLNDKEFETLKRFIIENNKNGGGCCPTIEIFKNSDYKKDKWGYYQPDYTKNLVDEKEMN